MALVDLLHPILEYRWMGTFHDTRLGTAKARAHPNTNTDSGTATRPVLTRKAAANHRAPKAREGV